ncbi:MAG TPA: hypothetical protein PL124_09085 [Candidatus Cloacimonadota bacterium]|nr:hypothetical protein [Candidatus Cloacimonadota bacterium]HPS39551.1 hypothetical protein [Candidatus Cloacimonadota bacterium]
MSKNSGLFDLGGMNSSYGEIWTETWCRNCYRNMNTCRILACALGVGAQPELIYDENGDPVCTKYKHKDEHVVVHRVDKNQMEIEI